VKKNFFLKVTSLLFVILLSVHIFCPSCQAALKAGCAKVSITPPAGVWLSGYASRNKPSEGISDELYVKALVLDDGQNKIAIVSADLLWVPLETTNEVRELVKQKVGIPESNILICATHTHFGPKIDKIRKDWPDTPASKVDTSYVQKLTKRIAESILTAAKNELSYTAQPIPGASQVETSAYSRSRACWEASSAAQVKFISLR